MSFTKTITVNLPPLPEGYELCERPAYSFKDVLMYAPSGKWCTADNFTRPFLDSDLAIFARPIAPKMRRMTMAELTALVPAGVYYRKESKPENWITVSDFRFAGWLLAQPDSLISTDCMKTWRKPEVEETK
jgi:hypothetical protein